MNPLQNFSKNVTTGARAVAKGITSLGSKKQGMAAKMTAPMKAPAPLAAATPTPQYNTGFHAYKDRLDEALKY